MTGYRSKYFRHQCAALGCYVDSLPCWDDMIEMFPRKIRPTDVDGFVEINGQFLFLEEKFRGKAPEEGQRKALKLLASLPGVTVAFFRPGKVADFEVLIFDGTEPLGWIDHTRDEWFAWLRKWAQTADSLGRAA